MVTFKYFHTYFLLLVLQFTASLCDEELIQNDTVSTEKLESASAQNSSNMTNSEGGLDNINLTNPISNVPLEDSDKAANGTFLGNTNTTVDILNLNNTETLMSSGDMADVPPIFPEEAINGERFVPFDKSRVSGNSNTTDIKDNTTENKVINSNDKIDTEVTDLNAQYLNPCNVSNILVSLPNITLNETQIINEDTELIEDGQNTEDILRNSSVQEKSSHGPGVPLVQGQLAAVLAGIFVVISIFTYIGLLSWRRFLEHRYGNRELLVDEEEFNDRDDLRHFSI